MKIPIRQEKADYYTAVEKTAKAMKSGTYKVPINGITAEFLGDVDAKYVIFNKGRFSTDTGVEVDNETWHTLDPVTAVGMAGGVVDYGLSEQEVAEKVRKYVNSFKIKKNKVTLGEHISDIDYMHLGAEIQGYRIEMPPEGFLNKLLESKWTKIGAAAALIGGFGAAYLESHDSDHDGVPDYRDRHPQIHENLYDYANSHGLDDNTINQISLLNPDSPDAKIDSYSQNFIKYISENSDKALREQLIEGFTTDGKISYEEDAQLKYLVSLTEEDKNELIRDGKAANTDFDGDGFTNWFEKNFGNEKNGLNPEIKNDRYFILSTTDIEIRNVGYRVFGGVYDFLINRAKIPEENIIKLTKATYPDFVSAVEKISQKADENDIVIINLHGHGGPENFCFDDGKPFNGETQGLDGKSYLEIDRLLDKINSGVKVITVDACHSGDSPRYLKGENIIVASQTDVDQFGGNIDLAAFFYESMGYDKAKEDGGQYAFIDKSPDINHNRYVSVGEALATSTERIKSVWFPEPNNFQPRRPQISDMSDIADDIYLFEYKLPDGYEI